MKVLVEKDVLVTLADSAVQTIEEIGGCDHAVNICCCSLQSAVDDARRAVNGGARPFKKTDWEFHAGATCWGPHYGNRKRAKVTDLPVIREFSECYIVADKECVLLISHTENGLLHEFYDLYGIVFKTQAAALAFLNGLPESFDPDDYGFVPST